MAEKTTFKLEGLKEVLSNLKDLDKKTRIQALKSLLRSTATQVKRPLISAAPYTEHNTFKNPRNVSVVADKEKKGAFNVGYNSKAGSVRWIEKGTKIRKTKSGANRGRITKKPFIEGVHRNESPRLIKSLNEDVTKRMVKILSRKSKSLSKKLGR